MENKTICQHQKWIEDTCYSDKKVIIESIMYGCKRGNSILKCKHSIVAPTHVYLSNVSPRPGQKMAAILFKLKNVWHHNRILGHARSENFLDLNTTQSFDHVICETQGNHSGTDLD